jgi:predicted  nucleic acid-binding Zn-ribbon protein
LTVTELAEEVRDTHRELAGAIKELRGELSALRVDVAKINTSLGWAKGIGMILAGSAVTILILAFSVAHRATQLEDAVFAIQKDFADFKKDFADFKVDYKARDKQIADSLASLQANLVELKADFNARDKHVAESLNRIEKTLAQTAPAKSALK